jgi:aminomethyltransferase
VSSLDPFQSTYSAFLNDSAGIVDDTIITNITESVTTFHVVTNAANYDVDLAFFQAELTKFKLENSEEVHWEVVENTGLVALQGPLAAEILKSLKPQWKGQPFDLDTLTFGHAKWLTFKHADGTSSPAVLASRTGYTGEDGFELSIPHPDPKENTTFSVTNAILTTAGSDKVRLAGLGARDALRLEAGLCLHGHDIDDSKTPIDAALVWIIPKSRRSPEAGFNGAAALYGPSKTSSGVRRAGISLEGKAAAREGDLVFGDEAGQEEVGIITSGAPSPTLQRPIAMGYLAKDKAKAGSKVWVKVRGKPRPGMVEKLPFVPAKYFKGLAN